MQSAISKVRRNCRKNKYWNIMTNIKNYWIILKSEKILIYWFNYLCWKKNFSDKQFSFFITSFDHNFQADIGTYLISIFWGTFYVSETDSKVPMDTYWIDAYPNECLSIAISLYVVIMKAYSVKDASALDSLLSIQASMIWLLQKTYNKSYWFSFETLFKSLWNSWNFKWLV